MNLQNIIDHLKINDQIDESMLKKLKIENTENEDTDYKFILDEWAVFSKPKFTEKLHMKFIKLWSILRFPIINYKKSTCEWRITGKDNDIYIIKSSDEDNGKSLINRENWIIMANTNQKNKIIKFLKHFGEAVECYDNYYTGIENGNFTSNNEIIQETLFEMQRELTLHSTILNTKF